MKDFDHLMSVWQEQPKKDQLSVDDVLKQVKKGMSGLSRKLFWNITSMVVSLAGLFLVMLFFVFNSWITYLGISIILITMILYVMMMVRDYRIIHKQDITVNPTDYLQNLRDYQKNRAEVYGWLYYVYVVLISAGLLLYFYEVLESASTTFKIIAYGLTTAWLLFCTFYLKGRFVKSEQDKLNLMIDRLIRLQNQFD
jgi:type IV secretory pathway TrbD component